MNTTILCPLTTEQIEALIAWHHQEARQMGPIQIKSDHLCDAAALRRRLIDAQNRTEDHT